MTLDELYKTIDLASASISDRKDTIQRLSKTRENPVVQGGEDVKEKQEK